jgi:hypothetical protein
LVFFTFVVLAFIFWLIRYYQQKFEIELSIPLQYEQVPPDLILSDSVPQKINLKIQDKGTLLLNYLFTKRWDAIDINLEDISLSPSPYVVQRNVLSGLLYEHLSTTTQLISFYPENIVIHYFPLKKKEVPVVLNGDILVAPGYIFADTIALAPSTIIVYGEPQVIDTLKVIRTAPVKKTNIDKKLAISLDLQIPNGIHSATDKVKLTADVEAYTEKSFELPIVSRNLPENRYVRFFPSTAEIICQVALSKYAQLTETDLEVSIDYNELKQNKNTSVALTLGKKPKGLINYRIVPERVEYLIEQKADL